MSEQYIMPLHGGEYNPPIFNEATWRAPRPEDLPPSFTDVKRLGLDTETKDEDILDLGPGVRRPGSYLVGYSFAIEDGPSFYIPFRHGTDEASRRDNVEWDALGYLRDMMKTFRGKLVGANLPYEIDWLSESNVSFAGVEEYLDVLVAEPLLYELKNRYSLDTVATDNGVDGKDEKLLREAARQYGVDPKKGLWQMPARLVGPYAEWDAVLPLKVMRRQERRIEEEQIEECWRMECRLLPLLVQMTRKGVRVDVRRLDAIETWTRVQEASALAKIKELTGVPMGAANDAEALGRVLHAADLAHLIGETATGRKSYAKDIFAGVNHPVAKALLRARQVATLRQTFVNGVRNHLVDGRIHCSFNQIRKTEEGSDESAGVAYGRLSSSHVNMQNQPGNSRFSGDNEVGPMWRSIYLPEDGEEWNALDLKQQEPKWSFHYSAMLEEAGVKGCVGALKVCERLRNDPTMDTYIPIVEIAKVKRATAKIIWLARCYGQGDGTLCEALGLPTREVTYSRELWKTVPVDSPEGERAMERGGFTWKGAGEEGQRIIDQFDSEMGFLKVAAKTAKKRADEKGFVKLLSGRRCHFEKKGEGKGHDWTHKAFNRIIQGTSAEQTKLIMLAVADAGYGDRIMLQVHDELDFSLPEGDRALAKEIVEVMRHAVPMKVPTVVDIEYGASWGESMGVEFEGADGKKGKTTYVWGMRIAGGEPKYFKDILSDEEWNIT